MKILFIVWGRELQLSANLAKALGADLRQVYYKKIGHFNIPTIFRYIMQSVATLFILFKERPQIVYVQNPPSIAPITVWLYSLASGSKFAIDSHTAAFLDPKWEKLNWLFKFIADKASLNTCHNFKNLEILRAWKIAPAMVMQFDNPIYDISQVKQPLVDQKLEGLLRQAQLPVLMVNRFASDDDDYETVFATAALMPEATFFVTGDYQKVELPKNLPTNVVLTGYLAHQEFLKLMYRSKVVLAFTLRRDTVLWSIREIMALKRPFVTTDSEVLRHYYGEVGLFTKSDSRELKERIKEAVSREPEIREKIDKFLDKDRQRWQDEINKIKKYLQINI